MKNLLILTVLLLTALIHKAYAFPPPERLVYDVTWNGISAGSAVIELTRQDAGYKSVNTIRSAGLVSTIFRIEDHIESVISADGRPRIYRASINEGRHHTRHEVVFDFKGLQAETTDLVRNTRKKEAITADTQDELSSLYFLRSRPLAPGKSVLFDIYDGKRLWNAEARVTKRQRLATRQGTVATLVVVSTLKADGVPSPVGGTTFWFSDDTRHIPLKIKTKLKVGEMVLTLKQHTQSVPPGH